MTADDAQDLDHLARRARAWIAGDPDPATRQRLHAAVERGDLAELRAALEPPLGFGTAGLRGRVGPGPARMNRATVIRATRGLADHVRRTVGLHAPVVVGFDARPDSETFARDAVGVLAAAGLPVRWFPQPAPTPLVAYAARVLDAAAAVVVTASHNPPADNGYKVYGPDAVQIAAPTDAEIAAAIDAVGPAVEVPREDVDACAGVVALGDEVADDYLAALLRARPAVAGPDVSIVYTPLHGVGGALATRALAEAGHHDVHVVASQARPDGTFPTLAFPNPEEPGTLDHALELAAEVGADLVVANDPDADRLALAVPDGDGGFRALTGNQVGVLLGDHLLTHTRSARPLVVSSVVSSPMFAEVAAAHGAHHEWTLTGFKWICRAALALQRERGLDPVLGYEEALGYAVGEVVRDKDGIGAAVVAADLVRALAAEGRRVDDRLEQLYARHGLWVGHQRAVAIDGPARPGPLLQALVERPPGRLGGRRVVEVRDHRRGGDRRPPWRPASDLVEVVLEGGRALVRPSGTEPKVKVYVDLRDDRRGDLAGQERRLLAAADRVAADLLAATGLG